jgi:hypothetical protein
MQCKKAAVADKCVFKIEMSAPTNISMFFFSIIVAEGSHGGGIPGIRAYNKALIP